MRLTNGEATIRANGRWAKVSRLRDGYMVAFGFEGELNARDIHSCSGKHARTWAEVASQSWVDDGQS